MTSIRARVQSLLPAAEITSEGEKEDSSDAVRIVRSDDDLS